MLQKFKMKTFSAVLGLFGFMLVSAVAVSEIKQVREIKQQVGGDDDRPNLTSVDERFNECQEIAPQKNYRIMKEKQLCFRELARQTIESISFICSDIDELFYKVSASKVNFDDAAGWDDVLGSFSVFNEENLCNNIRL